MVAIGVIGGHGFWGRGGVYTGGVSEKISAPPSAAPTPGGENFFSVGYFISRPGGHFAKNCKIGGPFGTPGCTPCLRQGGVSGDFRF